MAGSEDAGGPSAIAQTGCVLKASQRRAALTFRIEAHSAQPHLRTSRPPLPIMYLCFLQPRLHSQLPCGFGSVPPCQRSSFLEAPRMLFKNKELAPPSLEQEGPFMRFLEKYKLLRL